MFEKLEMAPPDPILGLTAAFVKDPNPNKINLGVGVYKAADGTTPVLPTVKRAEERILSKEATKNYLFIEGEAAYGAAVREMLFGAGHEAIESGRAVTAHTPGGTGGLRVAGDFIKSEFPGARVWMSDPTWANHENIFAAAGLEMCSYPYYDAASQGLDFPAMKEALKKVPAGDFALLHGCCHNPTGIDPTPEQWEEIAAIRDEAGWIPLVDFAYQGLGDGIEEDAVGLRVLSGPGRELLVISSFSKNFGLYCERVGALTILGADAATAEVALSQIKRCVRANYSNPPAHGSRIVSTILGDPELRAEWEKELKEMRDRINSMRALFVQTLKDKGVNRDFSFIAQQKGMFSFSGLKAEVPVLREKYGIYIVGSGRINVAGMTPSNMDMLCSAIAEVL